MAYNVRKAWPAEAAIDEIVVPAEGAEIAEGMIVTVADGEAKVADFTGTASPTDPMPAFLIGYEKVKKSYTALMHQCVIEVDAEHYDAGTYKGGDLLTAKAGKFSAAGTSKVIGRVLKFDASTGQMRVNFFESH